MTLQSLREYYLGAIMMLFNDNVEKMVKKYLEYNMIHKKPSSMFDLESVKDLMKGNCEKQIM